MNWKGEPLVSFETVVNMISATKTKQGLRIKAVLDKRRYETGVKISNEQMKELNLQPHRQNPSGTIRFSPQRTINTLIIVKLILRQYLRPESVCPDPLRMLEEHTAKTAKRPQRLP